MKSLLLISCLTFCLFTGKAQGYYTLKKLEVELEQTYVHFLEFESPDSFDLVRSQFRQKLLMSIQNPETYLYPFEALQSFMYVKYAPAQEFRVFSWDNKSGGTWHDFVSIAQIPAPDGKIIVQQLSDTSAEETGSYGDVEFSAIYKMHDGSKEVFMLEGYGTHGGGTEFNLIRAYTLTPGGLVQLDSIYNNKPEIVIESHRGNNRGVWVNDVQNTLGFNELVLDEEGYYRETGKIISLHFENGRFTAQ